MKLINIFLVAFYFGLPIVGMSQDINIVLEKSHDQPLQYSEKAIRSVVSKNLETQFENRDNVIVKRIALFQVAKFLKRTKLESIRFDSTCLFSSARFLSDISFQFSTFAQSVFFSDVEFESNANFEYTHFMGNAYFERSHFYGPTRFVKTEFRSAANFENADFDSSVDFSSAAFHGTTSYENAHFCSTVVFSNATLFSPIFNGATFSDMVQFTNANFKGKLDLSQIRISKNTIFTFTGASLPDTITLSNNANVFLNNPYAIDLTLCNFLKADSIYALAKGRIAYPIHHYFYPSNREYADEFIHYINLYNTDIAKIKIDYTHFRLFFEDETAYYSIDGVDSFTVKTLSKDAIYSIYENLLKIFKDRGQYESYELLDVEYQRYRSGLDPQDFSIEDWWWHYGYERWRIFIHSGIFIFLFSLYNFFRIEKLNDKSSGPFHLSELPQLTDNIGSRVRFYHWKKAWASIAYTSVLFFSLPIKLDKIRFSNFRGSVWIIFIYAIGLLCLAYIANFILKK